MTSLPPQMTSSGQQQVMTSSSSGNKLDTGMERGTEGNLEEEREDSGEHRAKRHKLSESTDPVNTEV